jgi:alkylated DNA repair dioxygenase AlkB
MQNLLPHKGELYYESDFFSEKESEMFFHELKDNSAWSQQEIKIYGKSVMQPRLVGFYGNCGVQYKYSALSLSAVGWNKSLLHIKEKIDKELNLQFNSALLNLYRDGNDSMGWHRDNEKELGIEPLIVSISFGALRKFQLREYKNKLSKVILEPASGSLILMKGVIQENWEHCVPKTKLKVGERVNVTFRNVL